MIRKFTAQDRALYLQLTDEFYHSEAVLHPVPPQHRVATFEELMRSDTYAEGYVLESDGKVAGFALLSKTFSQEAGGLVVWIEELYLRPVFRGKGIGTHFLQECIKNRPPHVKRFRLEVEEKNHGAKKLYQRLGFQSLEYQQMVLDFS